MLLSPACASFDQYPQFRGARRPLPRARAGAAGLKPISDCRTSAPLTSWKPWRVRTRPDEEQPWFRARTHAVWRMVVDGRPAVLAALFGLMLAGIILSLAASPPVAARLNLDAFHFVNRHVLFLAPTVVVLLATSFLSPRQIRRVALLVFLVSLRAGRADAVLRRRDQGRAALARIARRQRAALRVPQTGIRRPDRLAVRRIDAPAGDAGQHRGAGAAAHRSSRCW